MGAILERCGLAEDLLDSIGQLFGPVRGGLSYAVIFVGAILGAITGTVAASVIAMGVISLPVMMRYGYDMRHATGVIAASGTITQLIPPSLVLVVLADVHGQVGRRHVRRRDRTQHRAGRCCSASGSPILSMHPAADIPALPLEARTLRGWALAWKCVRGIVPSAALIFLVLGTIFMGLATPTEAGAMGAVGAMALAAMYRTLTWKLTYQAMSSTMRITAMVTFILIGARVFSLVFQGVGGGMWIEHMLTQLPGGQRRLPDLLDDLRLLHRLLPRLLRDRLHHRAAADAGGGEARHRPDLVRPADLRQHPDRFMHPPFGFALFYLRGIAPPEVKSRDIYLGSIPWIVLQLILVGADDRLPGDGDLLDQQAKRRSIRPRSSGSSRISRRPATADCRVCRSWISLRRRFSSGQAQKTKGAAGPRLFHGWDEVRQRQGGPAIAPVSLEAVPRTTARTSPKSVGVRVSSSASCRRGSQAPRRTAHSAHLETRKPADASAG